MIDATAQANAASAVGPSADAVRAQLARILDSAALRGSQRRRELLTYLVDETLAGRGGKIKGYSVALAVFGRDETFDPSADPVVRLEAGRLRRSLDSYYVDAGARDAVRITIPKGAYVAHFTWRERDGPLPEEEGARVEAPPFRPVETPLTGPSDAGAARIRRQARAWSGWRPAVLLATLFFLAGLFWIWLREDAPEAAGVHIPEIIVLPFETLGDGNSFLADGLTQELITDLMRFSAFRLYSIPASFRQNAEANPEELGRGLGVSYVVTGSVRSDSGAVKINARLADADSGRIIWSETYDRGLTPGALLDVQGELAAGIASALGEPYGIVHRDVADRLQSGAIPSMPSYECVLRAYAYRRTFADDLRAPTFACLEQATRRDPGYAAAWALLAWLHLDAARFEASPGEDLTPALAPALEAAQRAVVIAPTSVVALQALAAINYYLGDFDESERIHQEALALNPDDPETLAQFGWRLAARGRSAEGVSYGQRAIDRSVSPPGWYFNASVLDGLVRGDYAEMLASAERASVDGSGMSQAFIAIAQAELGGAAAAQEALARMAELAPRLARDPAAVYRMHGAADDIVASLVNGLRKAGWREPATP